MYHQISEESTQIIVDEPLDKADWKIQDFAGANRFSDQGVAVCKIRSKSEQADYMLSLNSKAFDMIEAKKNQPSSTAELKFNNVELDSENGT